MSNNITTVRQHLLDTLADLRNRDNPMEIDRARAVADVARVLKGRGRLHQSERRRRFGLHAGRRTDASGQWPAQRNHWYPSAQDQVTFVMQKGGQFFRQMAGAAT